MKNIYIIYKTPSALADLVLSYPVLNNSVLVITLRYKFTYQDKLSFSLNMDQAIQYKILLKPVDWLAWTNIVPIYIYHI